MVELYKARERSLHERTNMISSSKYETAIKISEKMLKKRLSIYNIVELTEILVQKVIEIKNSKLNQGLTRAPGGCELLVNNISES